MTPPKTLLPTAARDALIRELVETTRYVDPAIGEPYEPAVLPAVRAADHDDPDDS